MQKDIKLTVQTMPWYRIMYDLTMRLPSVCTVGGRRRRQLSYPGLAPAADKETPEWIF